MIAAVASGIKKKKREKNRQGKIVNVIRSNKELENGIQIKLIRSMSVNSIERLFIHNNSVNPTVQEKLLKEATSLRHVFGFPPAVCSLSSFFDCEEIIHQQSF